MTYQSDTGKPHDRLSQAGRTVQALETVYMKTTAFLVCTVEVTDKAN